MTIVVDTLASGEVDLYADADRNLKIDDRDRVTAASGADGPRRERLWRLPLGVALIENGSVRYVPRAIVFRLGASGQTLGHAAAGYLEGTVTLLQARKNGAFRPLKKRHSPPFFTSPILAAASLGLG